MIQPGGERDLAAPVLGAPMIRDQDDYAPACASDRDGAAAGWI